MKKISKYILILLLLIPIAVKAIELPSLNSKYIILYDPEEDMTLYEKDADSTVSIASLTKIMTTIVAIENIENLDDTVTITYEMLSKVPYDASIAGLRSSDKVTYRDLLYASILPSGADATTALAYAISGGIEEYVKLMNEKAKELELTNTHFANVTGYDNDDHYSTPNDVLKLLLYALDNDLFKTIYQTKEYTLTNGLKVYSTLNKYNPYGKYDLSNIIGSKTGFTDNAGLCMSAIIKVTDKELIFISLGANSTYNKYSHIEDTIKVIDYLNKNYENKVIYEKDELLFELPVIDSNISKYKVKVSEDFIFYTDEVKNENRSFSYDGLKKLSYKNNKGDKIGTITYHYENKVSTQDVFLDEYIKFSFPRYFKSHLHIIIIVTIILMLILLLLIMKKKKRKKLSRRKR